MRLNEIFKSKIDWMIEENTPSYFSAEFYISRHLYRFIAQYLENPDDIDDDPTWYIEFGQHDPQDPTNSTNFGITNTGNQYLVFSTIIDIMRFFIKSHNPAQLLCSAEEKSRQSLYLKMFKTLLPTWDIDYTNSGHIFTVSKEKNHEINRSFKKSS